MAQLVGNEILEEAAKEISKDIGIEIDEANFMLDNETEVVSIVLFPKDRNYHIVIPTNLEIE